ncbi:hypothetical protein [Janthinobacterium agaricidamnosum]|nr:hypothetical protein [Janthinobacterium agaricidamnosum]
MSEENAVSIKLHATVLCGKSWTAYVGTFCMALIFLFMVRLSFRWGEKVAAVSLIVAALIIGYRILSARSYQLYYDEVGVWLASGFLPWSKGISGVKWRDMDEATYQPSFWSWLSRSYTIRIGHRYTKTSEITLTGMANGKAAVATLNAHLQEMIRDHRVN